MRKAVIAGGAVLLIGSFFLPGSVPKNAGPIPAHQQGISNLERGRQPVRLTISKMMQEKDKAEKIDGSPPKLTEAEIQNIQDTVDYFAGAVLRKFNLKAMMGLERPPEEFRYVLRLAILGYMEGGEAVLDHGSPEAALRFFETAEIYMRRWAKADSSEFVFNELLIDGVRMKFADFAVPILENSAMARYHKLMGDCYLRADYADLVATQALLCYEKALKCDSLYCETNEYQGYSTYNNLYFPKAFVEDKMIENFKRMLAATSDSSGRAALLVKIKGLEAERFSDFQRGMELGSQRQARAFINSIVGETTGNEIMKQYEIVRNLARAAFSRSDGD